MKRPTGIVAIVAAIAVGAFAVVRVLTPRAAEGAFGESRVAIPTKAEPDAGFLDAYEEYIKLRAYPREDVDWIGFQNAAIERDALMDHAITDAPVWKYVGPTELGSSGGMWFGPSPVSGRVSAIAFEPGILNLPKVYAASPSGGVWRDQYPYDRWVPLSDEWPFLGVSSIAIHPTNPQLILVGTGDFDGGNPLGARGIRRTVDGGTTWTEILSPPAAGICISAIAFDPDNPNIVIATAGRGQQGLAGNGRIYRSTDAGRTWAAVGGTPAAIWSSVVMGALSKTTGVRLYYATATSPTGMVWRSADQGQTWQQLPVPLMNAAYDAVEAATSPTDPGVVYVLAGRRPQNAANVGVWRSLTGGAVASSWKSVSANVNSFPHHDQGTDFYNWDQVFYDAHIACSTYKTNNADVDVLYVGLIDLVASVNANTADPTAVRWKSVGMTYSSNTPGLHNDQHSIAFQPNHPNTALVGCDGGLYWMQFDPTNVRWTFRQFLNGHLGISEVYTAAFFGGNGRNPNAATQILAGVQDNEHYRIDSNGEWPNAVQSGDGHGTGIIPVQTGVRPNVVGPGMIQYASGYTSTTSGRKIKYLTMQRTADAWAHQASVRPFFNVGGAGGNQANNEASLFFPPIAINPTADEVFTGSVFLYRRTANAAWVRTGLDNADRNPITAQPITAIAVAPSRPATVYVGAMDGSVFVSRMSGKGGSWTQIDGGTFPRPITSIAVHPTQPNTIFVTLGGNTGQPRRVYTCADTSIRRIRWTSVSGTGPNATLPDVHTTVITLDPDAPSRIFYVGTDIGFFYTKDAGRTWKDGNTNLGLPKVAVNSISVVGNHANATIYVATYGRGLWQARYGDLP
ncbi:MAG: hypothetical protein M9921_12020 [Fimbriimonadaceae bacterium]|nr:hypothetical protein [Fimbriimonadaceae bacterium]